jgi:hypothetical protein
VSRISACLILAAAVTAASITVRGGEVVEIRLRNHFFAEPATVQFTVAVEPEATNRLLRVEADGERFFRASQIALSGDADKHLHTVEFKNLPAGHYRLRAAVSSGSGVRGEAMQELVVMGK